jgi:hypothetical protein
MGKNPVALERPCRELGGASMRYPPAGSSKWKERNPMLDVILIGLGLGFFALSVGYAYACERL